MGNTCKSAKSDATIQKIAEPSIPTTSGTKTLSTGKPSGRSNDIIIYEEKEEV